MKVVIVRIEAICTDSAFPATPDSFVLKGALLFRVWDTSDSRATRDIDFLGYVDNSPENLAAIVEDGD